MNEDKCEFCQAFIDEYKQDYLNHNFGGAIYTSTGDVTFSINYCPECGRKLEEIISD